MLPPASPSHLLTLPRPSSSQNRTSSYRLTSTSNHDRQASSTSQGVRNSEDDEDEDLRRELEMELEEEGGGGEREGGLEDTLERIGMGSYHWKLLALCGFGWMSDNSALTCIAVILPRVQIHYNLSSQIVGLLSASTMAGMMVGAIGWGTISDMLGRTFPFRTTLFLTAVFGIGASFSPNFGTLCCWMFLLGSAVGGSMPTDGTLFLENLPHSKQYLLTLLSVFFSLGAVLSSVISYTFLPGASCAQFEGCDIAGKANDGWRRVLFVLGLVNMTCALARWFLFRLHESPRYLATNGREQEAVVALRAIATYNENTIDITPADVVIAPSSPVTSTGPRRSLERDKKNSELPSPTRHIDETSPVGSVSGLPTYRESDIGSSGPSSRTLYDSVGLGPAPPPRNGPIRHGSAFYSASLAGSPLDSISHNTFERSFADAARKSVDDLAEEDEGEEVDTEPGEGLLNSKSISGNRMGRGKRRIGKWADKPIDWYKSWITQMSKLFVSKWRRTVILMWIIWGSMSFSYTMFNVWLPAVLESRAEGEGDEAIRMALREFMLYAVAGCPGSILGAWMIQTSLGRRKSLAICTVATGVATFAFLAVSSNIAVIISSMIISTAATAMYAVLYGMTPETFGTSIRGTACGTSSALSRLTGVMAPVSAGFLLSISPSLPLFASASILFIAAGCSLALPFERISEGRGGGAGAVMAH